MQRRSSAARNGNAIAKKTKHCWLRAWLKMTKALCRGCGRVNFGAVGVVPLLCLWTSGVRRALWRKLSRPSRKSGAYPGGAARDWASNVSLHMAAWQTKDPSYSNSFTIGYQAHNAYTYPAPSLLQSSVNAYLSQFSALETIRTHTRKAARSVPDEDGFITVTRGGRTGPARLEDAEKKKAELEERRKNNGVKDDFYRFQNREKRKEAENMLRRRFEEDRERVRGMRERRGKVRPET